METKLNRGNLVFNALNIVFMLILALLCVIPVIHIWALSFSSSSAAAAGEVSLWPVDWSLNSYKYVLQNDQFFDSVLITLQRTLLGTAISMILSILTAYPLSKMSTDFRSRTFYAWYFVFTILFYGGLIPWYITVQMTGIMDTIWALILPGAVQVFNVILLLNFFRGLPKELEESAFMDGAGYMTTLWRIYVPLSLPALATLTLLTVVYHWNAWFDGLILMNSPERYPLSTYLQTIVIQSDLTQINSQTAQFMTTISDRTVKASQIFLGALPIIAVYPFLQRFFVKGLVLGSVKE
ncbi:putative ABC transporter permease protein YtcP [Paenibacillus nasutitermitis]|uniref:ABC transporter permease protein YtcP n=2 Tax=Paenibacillus nasutitermitis TaxID=1652958 RepID=A0A916YTV6_9BACL|nr:putative ABC transporter permease protein YtcP [Paenibacillus nasutitermitis]